MIFNTALLSNRKYIFQAGSGFLEASTFTKQSSGTYSYTDASIVFGYSASSNRMTACCTNAAVDVTKYSKLVVRVNVELAEGSGYGSRAVVNSSKFEIGTAPSSSHVTYFTTSSTYYDCEVDVSSMSGSYYLGVYGYCKATITDMYLE